MALTIGEFTASLDLDTSGFDEALEAMLAKFSAARDQLVAKADEVTKEIGKKLGAGKGPLAAAGAGLGASIAGSLVSALLGDQAISAVVGFLVDKFKPALTAVADFINGTVAPALQAMATWIKANQDPLLVVAGVITAFFLPALIQLGIQTAIAAVRTVAAITLMVVQWGILGWAALASAARVALAWLIAMGPIALVVAAVVALVALIILNWDTIVNWTKTAFQAVWDFLVMVWQGIVTAVTTAVGAVVQAVTNAWNGIVDFTTTVFNAIWSFLQSIWNTIVGVVQTAITGVLDAIGWLASLPGRVGSWFAGVFNAAVGKLGELLNWLRGLPGMILGALGNLGSLLVDAGRAILEGLWNGLKSAANWVKDQILNLIKAIIPGPIRDILGIGSPSKVAAELGRWVPIGLAKGIDDASGVVARASSELAGLVAGNLGNLSAVGGPRSLAPAGIGVAAGDLSEPRAVVRIENFYATPDQTPADIASDLDWMSRGGG